MTSSLCKGDIVMLYHVSMYSETLGSICHVFKNDVVNGEQEKESFYPAKWG